MKILFLGPYRQCDGWGEAAKDYLRALLLTGHDITAKPVYMSENISEDIPKDLVDIEHRVLDERPDVVIQNLIPSIMDYQAGMRNIGLVYLETNHIDHTGWIYQMNLMDEIWVSSVYEMDILKKSGITSRVRLVPMPLNTECLDPKAKPLDISDAKGNFVFYFVGEYIERKNVQALLMAFHREFHVTEPVVLLLKLHKTNYNQARLDDEVTRDLQHMKTHMRLYAQPYGYTPELTITKRLSNEEMCRLHALGDCLVLPSRGESLCRPVLDAMYMGNPVIATDQTGMMDSLGGGEYGYLCKSEEVPAFVKYPPVKNLYTSRETWREIDILHLQRWMRWVFEHQDEVKEQASRRHKFVVSTFSYDTIAKRINEVLDDNS